MDIQQIVLGLVLFIVFWAFQAGYVSALGQWQWLAGVVVFAVILYIIGKVVMPKPSAEMQQIWQFAIGVTILSTIITTVLTGGQAAVAPIVISWWLIVFGAALFATGWSAKQNGALMIGLFWLIGSTHFLSSTVAAVAYLHFGLLTGVPYIIWGLIAKK